MKDIKYILKRIIIGVGIALVLMMVKSNVFAYPVVGYSDSNGNTYRVNTNNSYTNLQSGIDWWFTDLGTYQYYGNATQVEYFNVVADYSIQLNSSATGGSDGFYFNSSYLTSIRNTLKEGNLRCGIGDYATGGSVAYAPTITGFSATTTGNLEKSIIINVRFNYQQRIPKQDVNNKNISCWFVRQPTNGLYTQFITNGNDRSYARVMQLYDYTYFNLTQSEFDLTGVIQAQDRTTQAITDMNGNVIIVNNSINQVNQNLTDSTPPSDNELTSALDAGSLPGGGPISNIITFPLTMFNRFLSVLGTSCTDLTIPIPYVSQTATIQCVNVYFTQLGFGAFYEVIGGLIGGVVLFYYLMYLYDRVNHLLFLEEKGDLKKYYS